NGLVFSQRSLMGHHPDLAKLLEPCCQAQILSRSEYEIPGNSFTVDRIQRVYSGAGDSGRKRSVATGTGLLALRKQRGLEILQDTLERSLHRMAGRCATSGGQIEDRRLE